MNNVSIKDFDGMSLEDFYEMMQFVPYVNENGVEILLDLRYL